MVQLKKTPEAVLKEIQQRLTWQLQLQRQVQKMKDLLQLLAVDLSLLP